MDEIPEAYAEDIQDKIAKLKIKYSDNRFILSCRIAAYKSAMTGFTTLELADFDESYIEKQKKQLVELNTKLGRV